MIPTDYMSLQPALKVVARLVGRGFVSWSITEPHTVEINHREHFIGASVEFRDSRARRSYIIPFGDEMPTTLSKDGMRDAIRALKDYFTANRN